jgi:GMC oxidoreductase
MIRKIMQAEPIAGLLEKEEMPGLAVSESADVNAYIRDRAKTTFHPIGTCRMGMDDEAVVYPDLRVRGGRESVDYRRLEHAGSHQRQHERCLHDDRGEARQASGRPKNLTSIQEPRL